jgi:hypothetical protein
MKNKKEKKKKKKKALGLTQLLTEMSTGDNYWEGGKGDRCVGLITLPPL